MASSDTPAPWDLGGGPEPHKYGSSAALREALPKTVDSPLQLADEVLEVSSEDDKGPDDVGLSSQVQDAAVVHSDAKSRDDVGSEVLDASAVSLHTEEDPDLGDHEKHGKAGPEPDCAASHIAKRGRGTKRGRNKSKGRVTMSTPAPDSQITEAEELAALASATVLPEPVPDVQDVSQANSDDDTHSTEGSQAGACWPDATACLQRFWPHARAAGMTLLSTFLSLTFVVTITNIDPESYQPCNDQSAAGCVYQRIFPAGNIATTHGYFASVQNGHEDVVRMTRFESESFEDTPKWWKDFVDLRAGFSHMTAAGADESYQPPALCPNVTADAMRRLCTHVEVKEGVQNHLLGSGREWFLRFATLWCVLRILHDWLVIENQRQCAAYTAFLSLLARGCAASTAAYWAFGSTSVFLSPVENEDCACFYQMPAVQALLTLVTPMLMLKGSFEELLDWLRGVIFGDYLHFQPHRIPHHVEQSCGSWMSGHLMVWRREAIEPQTRMRPQVYLRLALAYWVLVGLWEIASFLMIAPLAPATLVRAEEVVQKFLGSYSSGATSTFYTLLDWMLYFTAWSSLLPAACFAYLVWLSYKQWSAGSGLSPKRQSAAFVGFFSAILACACLCAFVLSLGSPSSSLSQREAAVLRAELRAVGQYAGAAFLSLFAVVAASFDGLQTFGVLGGTGPMKIPGDYLEFCHKHPLLLQAYPDMEELKKVARKLKTRRHCEKTGETKEESEKSEKSEKGEEDSDDVLKQWKSQVDLIWFDRK
ncbi:unnamed protein product [Symbiodinium sp. CCMP2592]|nr:unnamed protein product [Symbiodinium sp. CCMP2592]